jgi:hypothetical protein
MKPKLDLLKKEIHEFEKKAGFDKTPKKKILKWLGEEVKNYRNAKSNEVRANKLIDILVLDLQLAIREGCSLDKAWDKWLVKSKKYINKR